MRTPSSTGGAETLARPALNIPADKRGQRRLRHLPHVLLTALATRVERLVDPTPTALISPRRRASSPSCGVADGLRPHLLVLTLLTAGIAVAEALLFSLVASLVDGLAALQPAELGPRRPRCSDAARCWGPASCWPWRRPLIGYQGVFGNFPMRLRWFFHGLHAAAELSFFGDEFAGRISTKVMQTALAVRDTWFIVADILVYVIVYFGTLVGRGGEL